MHGLHKNTSVFESDHSVLTVRESRRRNYPLATPVRTYLFWHDEMCAWLQQHKIAWSWEDNYVNDTDKIELMGHVRFKHAREQFLFELAWSEHVIAE